MTTTAKESLRTHFKRLRAALPEEERTRADEAIARAVTELPEFEAADSLLAYLSFGAETETRGIIQAAWKAGKTVCLPRCIPNTRRMAWHRVNSFDGLVKSPLGVDEPPADTATLSDPARFASPLCLVPGLTFDKHGYRLGYGGGFYDTFLASFDGTTIGLCRRVQLSDDLVALGAIGKHDLPVSRVVSD